MKNFYFNRKGRLLDNIINPYSIGYVIVNNVQDFVNYVSELYLTDDGVVQNGLYKFEDNSRTWITYDIPHDIKEKLIKYLSCPLPPVLRLPRKYKPHKFLLLSVLYPHRFQSRDNKMNKNHKQYKPFLTY